MPLDRKDASRVWDMLRHARIVVELVEGRRQDELAHDAMLRLALERAVEIIGEAARKVSDACEREHPQIPWKKIVQQRHVLSHDYGDLDYHILWRVATVHVPTLVPQLEAILPPPPPDPSPEDEALT